MTTFLLGAGMDAALAGPSVVPDFATGARVDGPSVVGNAEVEDAIDFERRGFDFDTEGATAGSGLSVKEPGELELMDIAGVDLIEGAVAATGIIAVIGRPTAFHGIDDGSRVEALGGEVQGAGQ